MKTNGPFHPDSVAQEGFLRPNGPQTIKPRAERSVALGPASRTSKALKGRDKPRPPVVPPFQGLEPSADSPRAALRSALGFIVCGLSGLNVGRLLAQQQTLGGPCHN